ncbi:biotin/lipoyl-containing protein [Burkholderia guangdongensis]|uniref:biotin/lipoyl-containing protein n=1 Tax=Burkholderia guangdongensis TaxID=1792500 RepID=UPI0015CBE551|nr:biotin/lipoyl-containing protein [Burkholderia guangdongensis]
MSTIEIVLQDEFWADVESGTEALVEEWLVGVGDSVAAGQAVATVVVVKTSHEVVAPAAGVIGDILVKAEETFAQGKAIGLLQVA